MNNEQASRTGEPRTPIEALSRVAATLQELNEKLIERDAQFDLRSAEMLAQARWANRLHTATLVLIVILGLLALRLFARQDAQQDRLERLAEDLALIDVRLTHVDATTESTRESVEVVASAAVQEPRVELEVRAAPASAKSSQAKSQLVGVIRSRRPSVSASVVIPLEAPSSAPSHER